MRIIIDKGILELPEDFSFEIEKTSSVFSEQGEQSIPVSLPATPHNLSLLGQPLRPERSMRYLRKIPALLEAGVLIRKGTLIISKYSSDGITASMVFSESVIYSKYKDVSLREIFKDENRLDYSTPVKWAEYLVKVYNGMVPEYDFAVFPVLVNKSDDTFFILNEPDPDVQSSLLSAARTVTVDGGTEEVPDGYGLTVFLYLRRLVALLFSRMGYSIGTSAIDDSYFNRVVVLNNNADTICDGTIHYADIVPSCTVAEFLEWMEAKFGIYISVSTDGTTVDLRALKDIYSSSPDMDLTGKADKSDMELSVDEPGHVVLKPDTSLDGAAPAAETFQELRDRHDCAISMDEYMFSRWTEILPSTLRLRTLICRLALGEYYELGNDENGMTLSRVGSDYFNADSGATDNPQERTPADPIPPLYAYDRGSKSGDVITALYIGERRHSRTSVAGSSESGYEQKIMIAADAGFTIWDERHRTAHRLGTVRGRDNLGRYLENVPELLPDAIFNNFFKEAEYAALNCNVSIKLTPSLPPHSLLSFGTLCAKQFGGARLLPKTMKYSVGKVSACGECEFALLQDYEDAQQSALPGHTFTGIYFYWKYCCDGTAAMDAWIAEQPAPDYIDNPRWEWAEEPRDGAVMLPYPSKAGLIDGEHKRQGRVWYRNKNEESLQQHSALLEGDAWYESVPLVL
ncbi:MAG TPA: hypothetical protein IAC04_05485 [Candidatus Coprenecus stercoravium]|uniref:Uncharacterized protein n=1 Tax=Candidatus Coprenecus stercoravium TaxID=2840735 RepID=A0A9D2GQQ4_9BACT|nr:hypothetical protein [Candidatus Coprenecus stercoravium]